jgi:hypothetical protein
MKNKQSNRRMFYDFAFSPLKLVSVAASVRNDQRIVEAHEQAVMVAMAMMFMTDS